MCVLKAVAIAALVVAAGAVGVSSAPAADNSPSGMNPVGAPPIADVVPAAYTPSPTYTPPVNSYSPYGGPALAGGARPEVLPAAVPATSLPAPQPSMPAPGMYGDPNWQKYMTPTVIREEVPVPAVDTRVIESTWYTKIEYFHWNERLGGEDFVNESGPLFTLGYQRQVGCERFRAELFGSQVDYSGGFFDNNNNFQPLDSVTNYLGVRAEYDLLFEPETIPDIDFFVGVGTRIWNRDLPETFATFATQEDWFTFYPYIGIERRRKLHTDIEFFWMARVGFTAVTLEHSTDNTAALYPKPGVTAQLEGGVRGQHLFASAFSEVMYWNQSGVASGWLQPASTMVTVGLRTGTSF